MSRIQVEPNNESLAKEDLLEALMSITTESVDFTDKITYEEGVIDEKCRSAIVVCAPRDFKFKYGVIGEIITEKDKTTETEEETR